MTGNEITSEGEPHNRRRSVGVDVISWLCLLTALPTLLAFGARWSWFMELFTHFRAHSLLMLTVAGFLLLAMKRWKLLCVVAVAWCWNAYLVAPCFVANDSIARGETFRILAVNVFGGNRQFDRCLSMIRECDADLVVCLEANQPWAEQLEELADVYQFRYFTDRQDNFGIAVLSRIPWRDLKLVDIDSPVPSVQLIVQHEGREFTFIGTHPPPPGRTSSPIRNRQLAALGTFVSKIEMPTVVAGDLNTTPWSPFFQDFVKTTKLNDARNGHGIQPTWPSRLGRFGIPIDYVLATKEFQVCDCTATVNFGSDHRGIVADLSW